APEWDGWPDGTFERTFSIEEVEATKNLAVHWVCQTSGSKVGSDEADEWVNGRKTERRCRGVISCENPSCDILEEQKFTEIVESHPKSGPLQLLVGVPTLNGPGKSVADISSVLVNKDRIAHELKKIRRGKAATNSADDINLSDFSDFCQEHPGFVIHSVIRDIIVISMQQPLMLAELVKETRIVDDPVNGIVSDAAHGFWRQKSSLLIISSAYSLTLRCWIPGILSYTNGATSEHYRHHFLALFQSIARERRSRGWDTSNDADFGNVRCTTPLLPINTR
ncbi:hypothetical protein C8Q80DRAFT_1095345, partial [Daedaleopsis nitida]